MKCHVENVTRSCFYNLRQLLSLRRSLIFDATCTLVHAFINSRVDYCNAVLNDAADGVVRHPQMVLHAAARLITGTSDQSNRAHNPGHTGHAPLAAGAAAITDKIALMAFN
jgi:hypothetical protein